MKVKEERKVEAQACLRSWAKSATEKTRKGEPKASILFIVSDWRSNNSGLSCRIDVRLLEGSRVTMWLTLNVADATGTRFNRKSETISMGGYGYSRSTHLAQDLARVIGKPIHCQTIGECFGANGWVQP